LPDAGTQRRRVQTAFDDESHARRHIPELIFPEGQVLCLSQIRQSAQPNGKQEKCHQVLPPSATVNLTEDKSCPEPRLVPSHGKAVSR
jgi:hypothetical protein